MAWNPTDPGEVAWTPDAPDAVAWAVAEPSGVAWLPKAGGESPWTPEAEGEQAWDVGNLVYDNQPATITGLWTFDRGVGEAPFAVAAGSAYVANLDADKLDGEHGAYYLDWANFTGTPTTLAGYGITDAYTKAQVYTKAEADAAFLGIGAKAADSALLDGQAAAYYLAWGNLTGVPATFPPDAHVHGAGDITSGTFADGLVAESNVTQHVGAIDHNALLNYAVGQHRTINDAGSGATDLWSASKIGTTVGLYLPLTGGTLSGDLYMGANGIGNNASVLTFAAGTGGFATLTSSLAVQGPALALGVSDTTFGYLNIYGHATGSAQGGIINLYTAADHDTSVNFYSLNVYEDDLRFRSATTTKLTLQGSDGTWLFGAAVGMGSNAISGIADLFLDDGGQVGISGNELLTFNAAGNITVSGATLFMGANAIGNNGTRAPRRLRVICS